MTKSNFTWVALAGAGALAAVLVAAPPPLELTPAAAADHAGKTVFTEHKCNECHTVEAEGVERTKPKKGDPPDLSGVGSERKRDWIQRFLQKKETIDGKKHKKKFRGDASEEKALLDWLTSLKSAAKK